MTTIATWTDGAFTLAMLGAVYGLACVLSDLLTKLARRIWCGRRACAWCKVDLGRAPGLEHGHVTHGICPTCLAKATGETNLTGNPQSIGESHARGKKPGARAKGLGRAMAGSRS